MRAKIQVRDDNMAGYVVLEDVKEGMVVGGVPAKVIKKLDSSSLKKKEIIPSLRKLT